MSIQNFAFSCIFEKLVFEKLLHLFNKNAKVVATPKLLL